MDREEEKKMQKADRSVPAKGVGGVCQLMLTAETPFTEAAGGPFGVQHDTRADRSEKHVLFVQHITFRQ
jgi:hypothetical protein